jgi:Tol biopolymer transport system component
LTVSKAEPRAIARWRAVALVALSIVAGLLTVQCANQPATPTGTASASQLCVSGATQLAYRFGPVRGFITYNYGSEIWAVDPNHPANPISLGPSHGQVPIAWSLDGSRLLLTDRRDAGAAGIEQDLCVMNADGSEKLLTSDGRSGEGSFSPDGTKVVFARSDDGLYVVEAEGGTPRLIVKSYGGWSFESPAWSPDGSRIAYTTYLDAPQRFIWTVNPDGTDPRQLVDLCKCGGLAWSPDGSMLAFHSWPDNPGGTPASQQIYTVRADGSALHPINDDGFQPSWSPDGARIAFLRDYGFAELGLYTMAVDGSDVRQVEDVFVMPSSLVWNPVH